MEQEKEKKQSTYQGNKPIKETAFQTYQKMLRENAKLKAKELELREIIKKAFEVVNRK